MEAEEAAAAAAGRRSRRARRAVPPLRVVSASGLARGSVFDKSDPFVRVLVAGVELGATRALDDTTEPVWDELVLDGGGSPTAARRRRPGGPAERADRDHASDHDPLGDALILLEALEPDGTPLERAYPVRACEGCSHAEGHRPRFVVTLERVEEKRAPPPPEEAAAAPPPPRGRPAFGADEPEPQPRGRARAERGRCR